MSTALEFYTADDLLKRTSVRAGETKLGQTLLTLSSDLWESDAPLPTKFTLVGIEEDFGVRANHGRGGAHEAFQAFLQHFCNLQDNRFFPTEDVAVLGALVPTRQIEDGDIAALREATAASDALVQATIARIVQGGSIPIVIGGGHNNSYGCIAGSSTALDRPISCLNIDAHTDLRAMEGRHSGNGFRYAKEHGFLGPYFMLGLQENYTPESLWQYIEDHEDIDLLSYEDFLAGEESLEETYVRISELLGREFGLEIDVDVVANFPSSAQSPSGFTLGQLREMIYALDFVPHYLHLCEGRITGAEEFAHVGRGLALLTADFIKAHIYSE